MRVFPLTIASLLAVSGVGSLSFSTAPQVHAAEPVDFNRNVRQLLSNRCFKCHGPDDAERQAGLRLDTLKGATSKTDSGTFPIVPRKPEASELIRRIKSGDPDERMPPPGSRDALTKNEVELLELWISEGAKYAKHWAYEKPVRSKLPDVAKLVRERKLPNELAKWPRNSIDHFILARLIREGLQPMPEADRYALVRRLSLDLTGLPPTIEEVSHFVNDKSANAYEALVDRLLAKDSYGEHWARKWLDLARYADSSGYADDPPRTIWAFRDYTIRSINANKPFDQFTIEQVAGDLLPNATEEQLIATAFHRNTLTNNEGGTNDEEFRNVAIVDRVNTTMAVWMGTTIACAQCHNHKYDPITQSEYFQFFAFFNNTEDADRRNESPIIQIYSEEQRQNRAKWERQVAQLEKTLITPTPKLAKAQLEWEARFGAEPKWTTLVAKSLKAKNGAKLSVGADGVVAATKSQKTESYTLTIPVTATKLTGLRLESLPADSLPGKGAGFGGGNFVVSRLAASVLPPEGARQSGRYIRVELPGKAKMLSLAEVQVFSGSQNVAIKGEAKQSSTGFAGPAKLAIDGNTNGDYTAAKSTTHTAQSDNPWWELDLKTMQPIDRVVVWNRTDGKLQSRLDGFKIQVLDELRDVLFEQTVPKAPQASAEFALSAVRGITFATAFADHSQPKFPASAVIDNKDVTTQGWSVGGQLDRPHQLTLIAKTPVDIPAESKLEITIDQLSKNDFHTLGRFRVSTTNDADIATFAQTPAEILAILKTQRATRTSDQSKKLETYFLGSVSTDLKAERNQLAKVKKQLADLKPATSVPVMRELAKAQRRTTKIQLRGNYQMTTDTVTEGLPAVLHGVPKGAPLNRLTLAKWLVSAENPLTARVIANRYWETVFGIGIVSTSEEFGTQGDRPFHPELLDWLATELVVGQWDTKAFIKLLVTSAAYRQSARVSEKLLEVDPHNRLLARGPRFRLSAEMIRDQALFVSGMLSKKMYGAPVRPPQPNMGVTAAFGSSIDWTTSGGEDKYRRGLYTTWRRSNPYPSMIAFDATNREVCTVRRDRTNTPLQAFVTLNDPVFVEAAQALGRIIAATKGSLAERVSFGFQRCLARPPTDQERERLVGLFQAVRVKFAKDPEAAKKFATMPIGATPKGADVVDLAAWTLVGNVLLNLDEMFMKR